MRKEKRAALSCYAQIMNVALLTIAFASYVAVYVDVVRDRRGANNAVMHRRVVVQKSAARENESAREALCHYTNMRRDVNSAEASYVIDMEAS